MRKKKVEIKPIELFSKSDYSYLFLNSLDLLGRKLLFKMVSMYLYVMDEISKDELTKMLKNNLNDFDQFKTDKEKKNNEK